MARLTGMIVAVLAVPACGAVTFHSSTPHVARDPDLEISVDDLAVIKPIHSDTDTPLGVRVGADVIARPGAAWGTPRLGAAAVPPCGGGLSATGDVTFTAGGPAQRTVLSFADPIGGGSAPFTGGTAVLDVPVFPADRTQPGRCLRVSLQSLAGAAEWHGIPWLFGLGVRVAFLARPLRGYEGNALLFDLSQGTWVGGYKLTVGFQGGVVDERGVASVLIPAPTNPQASTRPTVGLVGGDAELGRMLWSGGHLGLEAQLGYDLLFTLAPNASTDPEQAVAYQSAVLHGPRLALRVLAFLGERPGWPGFSVPPDATSAGLSVFAAAWWQSSGAAAPAPVFGFSLDGNVGL